jgi:hypothetical protein
MLEILREDFKHYSPKNISIEINEATIKTQTPLIAIDSIQVMINNYDIYKTDTKDKIYAVLSQYVVEDILSHKDKFQKSLLEDYTVLIYPNDEAVAKNKEKSESLIESFKERAAAMGVNNVDMHIIPYVVPTQDALIMRQAAKSRDKRLMLKYVSVPLANYIISRGIYTDPRCKIQNGGRRRRSRRAILKRRQTRRRR